MAPGYRITEPHPSLPTSHYYHSGRGGAGNITHISDPKTITSGSTATGPASLAKLTAPPPHAYFATGRGGAGNIHREKERAIFSFDEELAQQQRIHEHAAPVYHIGRGGAGNLIDESMPSQGARKGSAASMSSQDSDSSAGVLGRGRKSVEGAWQKVTRSLSRHS